MKVFRGTTGIFYKWNWKEIVNRKYVWAVVISCYFAFIRWHAFSQRWQWRGYILRCSLYGNVVWTWKVCRCRSCKIHW